MQPHLFRRVSRVLLGAVLAAISVASNADVVLHRGNTGEPESLDPAKSTGVWEAHIQRDLFEGLVAEAADGSLIPGVAESWKASDDGRTYVFHLRDDAKWSNGELVTAEDFVFGVQRLLNPLTGSKYASILYTIQGAREFNTGKNKDPDALGMKAEDARTLRITLTSPTPYFVQQLAHHTAYPIPKALVETLGDDWSKPGNMISNGPYQLVEWVPQAHVKVIKNPHFHDADSVQIDTVYFYPTEDRSTALKRFRAGELDINDDIPDDQVKWIRQNLGNEFRVSPYLGIYYYAVNTSREPFNDARLRRALAMAIRREILVEKITGAGEIAAYGLVPPGVSGYQSASADFKEWTTAERMDTALRLLQDAGYGPQNPLRFRLSYNTSENHKKIAVAIASMWKGLGVAVELFNTEAKVHYNDLKDGRFDVARAAWIADYDDAQNFLFLLETSNSDLNYAEYSNPEYDQLMAAAATTSDLQERAALMHRAETIALRDMPYIPIYYYVTKNLVKNYVLGWMDNVKNVHPTRYLRMKK